MAATPEARVKQRIREWLKQQRIWYYQPIQNGMGQVGIPDFICCKPVMVTQDMVGTLVGQFVGIEAKAPGKLENLTPNQIRVLDEISEHHGVAVVIDDVEHLKGLL